MIFAKKFKAIILCVVIGVSLSSAMSGCSSATDKEDIKEAFLKVYLTSNYDNRYSTFKEQSQIRGDMSAEDAEEFDEEIERLTDAYYACIQEFVSEDLYNKMIANRSLYRIDNLADDRAASIYPSGFEFSEYVKEGEKTTYKFVVELRIDTAGESSNGTIGGQIMVLDKDDTTVISDIFISKFDL